MIDVRFIREVDVYTSAFPAARGNALSSVMDFRMRDGNAERAAYSVTVGASDLGVTAEGPLGARSTMLFSARRSYLQFLFKALGLPFVPTYNDAQLKVRTRLGSRDEVELLGLGAIDDFALNQGEKARDTEFKRYLFEQLPINSQWNYTSGLVWKHLSPQAVTTTTVSRSKLDNRAHKYAGNDESDPAKRLLEYRSQETERKLRLERSERRMGLQLDYGVGVESATYTTSTFQRTASQTGPLTVDYDSRLTLTRGALFVQASRAFAADRLTLALGHVSTSPTTRRTRSVSRISSRRVSRPPTRSRRAGDSTPASAATWRCPRTPCSGSATRPAHSPIVPVVRASCGPTTWWRGWSWPRPRTPVSPRRRSSSVTPTTRSCCARASASPISARTSA
jgi:hypothetical protein